MRKMNLEKRNNKRGIMDSSDSDSSDNEEKPMEIEMSANKQIKKKPLPRSYYQSLKKTLRRKLKDGIIPDVSKLDAMLEKYQ